jgi:quinoprotein glucose dehydrogenase
MRLPAGAQATPMSYEIEGRQYVVVAAGGHAKLGTTRGDHLLAFVLPKEG